MKKSKFISLIIIIIFTSLIYVNSFSCALIQDTTVSNNLNANEGDITDKLFTPYIIDQDMVRNASYHKSVKKDKNFNWKITEIEQSLDSKGNPFFHVQEADKNLKINDKLIVQVRGEAQHKDRTHPEAWSIIYINDVQARYDGDWEEIEALYRFITPYSLNITLGGPSNYSVIRYFDWVNASIWDLDRDAGIATINTTKYTIDSTTYFVDGSLNETEQLWVQIYNTTFITLIYDIETSILNEMYYSASYSINGVPYSANFTLIKTHGWGLLYYTSTLVVWIPIIIFFVFLVVALRMRLFQKIKLYFEARKLIQRE